MAVITTKTSATWLMDLTGESKLRTKILCSRREGVLKTLSEGLQEEHSSGHKRKAYFARATRSILSLTCLADNTLQYH